MARAKIWNGSAWVPATDGGVLPASGQVVAGSAGGPLLSLGAGQYPKGDGTNIIAGLFENDVAATNAVTQITPNAVGQLISYTSTGQLVRVPMGVVGQGLRAYSTGLKWLWLVMIHVDDFGGDNQGIQPNDTAIANAIAAGKVLGNIGNTAQGCLIAFGAGAYSVRQPIIIPKNGSTPNQVVHFTGVNPRATAVIGHSTLFPVNRAVFEWDPTSATRIWHGRIANMRIHAPNISGTACIRHTPVNPNALDNNFNVISEWMQCNFENLNLTGNNDYHQSLMDLGIGNRYGLFWNVFGDPSPGTLGTYDTVLIKTPSDYTGGGVGIADAMGIGFCEIHNTIQDIRVGGYGQVFSGRVYESDWSTAFANGGRPGTAAYDFKNSWGGVYRGFACEGRSETAQISLDACIGMNFLAFQLGTPNPAYPGWAANHAYTVGQQVVQTTLLTGAGATNNMVWQCTVAGTSGATEPVWTGGVGATMTDNTVTWQAVAAATGSGVLLKNGTRDCHFEGRITVNGNNPFSRYLAKVVTIDSTCYFNIFERFQVRANGDGLPTAEFQISATADHMNFISGTDLGTGTLKKPYSVGWHPHYLGSQRARTLTASGTLDVADSLVKVDATAGVVTITPPSAVGILGKRFTVLNVAGAANGWVLDPAGAETVNGALTYSNTTLWQSVTFQSDDFNWIVVSVS